MSENPFRPTRFEHTQQPLLWVSSPARQLESESSFYVQGTRGSGKTSLLRTLHWQERLFNDLVRAQIPNDPPSFLSIYFRLPDHVSFAVSRIDWTKIIPEGYDHVAASFAYFSALIESSACYLLFRALDEHRIRGVVEFSAEDALSRVSLFLQDHFGLQAYSRGEIRTYSDLADACLSLSRTINVSATRGLVSDLLRSLPPIEPGIMLSDAAALVTAQMQAALKIPKFHVKICIDDCEVLRRDQQIALNTLVRESKSPLFWIISYVGADYEATTGLYHSHNLTDADRRVINLDETEESYFRRLCEAVSSLRIYNALPPNDQKRLEVQKIDQIFSLERTLGGFDLNRFLDEMRRGSVSEDFDLLRLDAEKLREVGSSILEASQERMSRYLIDNSNAPPYYQAYLIRKLMNQQQISRLEKISKTKARSMSAYLRRKQRSAMIAICSEYRFSRIPYAGLQVAIGLSDACIRDYLEIMAEIYDEFEDGSEKLSRFCFRRTPLSMPLQRAGMVRAGENKFTGIREYAEAAGAELAKLVAGLGELTALLQRDVRTAERGIFLVDLEELSQDPAHHAQSAIEQIVRVLARGEAEGLLRPEHTVRRGDRMKAGSDDARTHLLSFRLHRRFASKFGFSFRGPYEPTRLPALNLLDLCVNAETVDAKQWASDVYRRMMDVDPRQPELFS